MDISTAQILVSGAGVRLIRNGLAARTWGNISCRTDSGFVITPSGLGYEGMLPEDTVSYDAVRGEYSGKRMPSTEKGIHLAAYRRFPEAGFVLHTHSVYASAIGIAGFSRLAVHKDEIAALGGVSLASYGLPGTKKLINSVDRELAKGSRTVLMAHHGALIVGDDIEDAFDRAIRLEALCRECSAYVPETDTHTPDGAKAVIDAVRRVCPHALLNSDAACIDASSESVIRAQLDDMAQIIGLYIPIRTDIEGVLGSLKKTPVCLMPGVGAVCAGYDDSDSAALSLLAEKACICGLHAAKLSVSGRLSIFDTLLMRRIYIKKYSKRKDG